MKKKKPLQNVHSGVNESSDNTTAYGISEYTYQQTTMALKSIE
ncbi:hypothetical protein [Brachyspira pilosicoli]|nr:hypothetical protein [Brachyspira pilosicoli]